MAIDHGVLLSDKRGDYKLVNTPKQTRKNSCKITRHKFSYEFSMYIPFTNNTKFLHFTLPFPYVSSKLYIHFGFSVAL